MRLAPSILASGRTNYRSAKQAAEPVSYHCIGRRRGQLWDDRPSAVPVQGCRFGIVLPLEQCDRIDVDDEPGPGVEQTLVSAGNEHFL